MLWDEDAYAWTCSYVTYQDEWTYKHAMKWEWGESEVNEHVIMHMKWWNDHVMDIQASMMNIDAHMIKLGQISNIRSSTLNVWSRHGKGMHHWPNMIHTSPKVSNKT